MRARRGFHASFITGLLAASTVAGSVFAQAPNPADEGPSNETPSSATPTPTPTPTPSEVPAPSLSGPRPLAESLTGDAKQQYEIACLLYDNGDYAAALPRFERAHQLSADTRLLWNSALCQKALHHYAKANALMRRYLASSSPPPTPAAAASARKFVAAAELLTERLEVSSNVSGALVFADGDSLGRAPLGPDARLDWGTHRIVVKKPDYTDYQQTVRVGSGAGVRVVAVLRAIVHEGRVIVRAGSGDLIAIDGLVVAWGTWEGVLASGRHVFRVSGAGFRPHEQVITVADAQTQGFDVTLERTPASSLPTWVWLAGGTVLAAAAVTAGYFIFKPDAPKPTEGSLGTVPLDLGPGSASWVRP